MPTEMISRIIKRYQNGHSIAGTYVEVKASPETLRMQGSTEERYLQIAKILLPEYFSEDSRNWGFAWKTCTGNPQSKIMRFIRQEQLVSQINLRLFHTQLSEEQADNELEGEPYIHQKTVSIKDISEDTFDLSSVRSAVMTQRQTSYKKSKNDECGNLTSFEYDNLSLLAPSTNFWREAIFNVSRCVATGESDLSDLATKHNPINHAFFDTCFFIEVYNPTTERVAAAARQQKALLTYLKTNERKVTAAAALIAGAYFERSATLAGLEVLAADQASADERALFHKEREKITRERMKEAEQYIMANLPPFEGAAEMRGLLI
jgi:uncharacterized protein YqfB (UPF0267 family)